ncbi:MAG: xanthine dehydrogenase family protein subunit M [Gammaproteobacteria bacterium]|nr:xanthine dehydrogenase family protein subunit M [Gammaproteobacteria bacterium]MYF38612.1 xanthine dehydrogenase family protein subunit M [Gammaproteobacteria bacterium]
MSNFGYVAPTTVEETLSVLKRATDQGQRAQILAGGTDVIVQMRSVDNSHRLFVDIKALRETNEVLIEEEQVYIGAAIPSGVLNENATLKTLLPGLLESADLIGSTQIQGRASIGGNLCNSSPAGDTIPALIANAAICVIATSEGIRTVPVENFVTGVGRNCLVGNEFLLGFQIPRPSTGTGDAYLRFIPRTEMDIAVVGAAVAVTLGQDGICSHARVAIGAVAPTPLLVDAAGVALVDTPVDEEALRRAAQICSDASQPITDKRGTIEYRRKVVGVLCRRAGAIARDRALSNQ